MTSACLFYGPDIALGDFESLKFRKHEEVIKDSYGVEDVEYQSGDWVAVRYQSHPLDKVQEQPVEMVRIC